MPQPRADGNAHILAEAFTKLGNLLGNLPSLLRISLSTPGLATFVKSLADYRQTGRSRIPTDGRR